MMESSWIHHAMGLHAIGRAGASPLASITLGPVQFDSPVFLILLPALVALAIWIARRNLSGLSSASRKVAIGIRLLLITLLVLVLSEPQTRRTSKDVSVTAVLDASRSIPAPLVAQMDRFIAEAAQLHKQSGDRLGVITVARDARVQDLPRPQVQGVDRKDTGPLDGTDLASAIRLAMAVMPKDAANRLLLMSDGNETAGSLLQAAQAARAAGVPIDVVPIVYEHKSEVIVERLVVPATARMGETVAVKVVMTATAPVEGLLSIMQNGTKIDLDPDTPDLSMPVSLTAGVNVKVIPLTLFAAGPQEFEAIFEPLVGEGGESGDAIMENNRALAVSFVAGRGRVLLVSRSEQESRPFAEAMAAGRIDASVIPSEQFPGSLTELNGFDAVVLINQNAYEYTLAQQVAMRQYVHDSGGGLVMIGGPDSFGAGGWIGSPIEEVLPVRLDPPQKRQMPRGALVLIIHSVEMPQGVFYGKQVANAAVDALSRLDLAGIIEYSWGNATDWVHPLVELGDKSQIKQAINGLQFGDMQDFSPSFNLALQGLLRVQAGQKHVIMISDGDPTLPPRSLLQKFVDAKISVSTVGVFPHSPADTARMSTIARDTGGQHYEITTQAALATLPQIFIKEAQTIRRSLIWEGQAFAPRIVDAAAETMRGISGVPPISGYVVTADREGLSVVTMRGQENDPIAAQWQFGLGRSVAFTSDAATRWSPAWVSWPGFNQFWQQHIRWAMRPSGSANVRVTTENRGDQTLISIDALDQNGERLNFAQFRGRLALPDGGGQDVQVQQIGPGRYEARVPTEQAGTYLLGLRYAARPEESGPMIEGTVQAAITRPFADEFRAIRDNAPLLRQIAEMTGGKVLSSDPRQAELWRRDDISMPVATTPIWLTLAICSIALFLADVGVRRVRIDPHAIARRIAGLFGASKVKQGAQIGSLQAARDKARERMSEADRGSRTDRAADPAPTLIADVAARKFESGPGTKPDASSPLSSIRSSDAPGERPKPRAGASEIKSAEEGMSALMKAKKRAQEQIDDQSRPRDDKKQD
ncbi:MAG: VWA domain-containing protein [Phycisphaeraceae bacterium]|nr:VWA domain-containing protein [Phycisphaeraceae bacterium]MBX3368003.1 VWA domain-containing protein [Phycisphaeraceae bacterium]